MKLQGSRTEEDVYFCREEGKLVGIVAVFEDDIKVLGEKCHVQKIVKGIRDRFKCSDDGPLAKYVGLEFKRVNGGVEVKQEQYSKQVLEKFGMSDCNEVDVPTVYKADLSGKKEDEKVVSGEEKTSFRSAVMSLMFLAINTSPDLCWIVNALAQNMENPVDRHMHALKRALRYLKGTTSHGLKYKWGKVNGIEVYSDSDWRDPSSTCGGVLYAWGKPVKWWTRKKKTVAMSTTEAELVGQAEAVRELRACQNFAEEALEKELDTKLIYGDNAKAIDMSNGDCTRRRVKHLNLSESLSLHAKEMYGFNFKRIPSAEMNADILTKAMGGKSAFLYLKKKLGIGEISD